MNLFLTKLKHRDKKAVTSFLCATLICALIVTGGIFVFQKVFRHPSPITSFQTLTLRLSGMRLSEEYELLCQGDQTQITLYWFVYENGEEIKQPQKSALCSTQEVLTLLNDCSLASWNGFHGKHPKNVMDGTMFHLEATVGDGEKIVADGSQNFPKHFHELEDGFTNLLHQ